MIERVDKEFEWEGYHEHWIESVSYDRDGKILATGAWDKKINLWDLQEKKFERSLYGHSDAVLSVSFSKLDDRLASGSKDNTIQIWIRDTALKLNYIPGKRLEGHTDRVYSIDWSAFNSNILVSGSWDFSVKIWNITEGSVIQSFMSHEHWCHSVHLSPLDPGKVASGSTDKTGKIWNTETGQLLYDLKGHSSYVSSISFSPFHPHIVATGSDDTTAKIWDTNQLESNNQATCIQTLRSHTDWVNTIAFSPHYHHLFATGSKDYSAKLWDWQQGLVLFTISQGGHTDWINSIAFSSTNPNIFTTASGDRSVKIWTFVYTGTTLATQQHTPSLEILSNEQEGNRPASPSPPSSNIAAKIFTDLKSILNIDQKYDTIPVNDDFFDAFQLVFPDIDFEHIFAYIFDNAVDSSTQSLELAESLCRRLIDPRNKGSIKLVNFSLFYKKFSDSNLSMTDYFRSHHHRQSQSPNPRGGVPSIISSSSPTVHYMDQGRRTPPPGVGRSLSPSERSLDDKSTLTYARRKTLRDDPPLLL